MEGKELQELIEANPEIQLSQWVWRKEDFEQKNSLSRKLTNDAKKYRWETSMIYYADVPIYSVKIKNGVPKSLISAKIYITVEKDGQQWLEIDEYGTNNKFGSVEFWPSLARISPNNARYVDCRGDKCRNSFNVMDTGVWCTACHGEIDNASAISIFIPYTINVAKIDQNAILHYELIYTPYNSSKLDHVKAARKCILADENKMDLFNRHLDTGGVYDQQITAINKLRIVEAVKRKALLDKYDGDLMSAVENIL